MTREVVSRIIAADQRAKTVGSKLIGPRGTGVVESLEPLVVKLADGQRLTIDESDRGLWHAAGRPRPATRLLQSALDAARARNSGSTDATLKQVPDTALPGSLD